MAKSIASLEAKYFRAREQELLKELNLKATTCPLTVIYNRQVVFDSFTLVSKKEILGCVEQLFSMVSQRPEVVSVVWK